MTWASQLMIINYMQMLDQVMPELGPNRVENRVSVAPATIASYILWIAMAIHQELLTGSLQVCSSMSLSINDSISF